MAKEAGITLKDIARETGFSLVSVHRALSGKPGVGPEARQKILECAEEMRYRPNVMASALKRRQRRIAIVMPKRRDAGARYFDYMWKGCDAYLQETLGLGVACEKYEFDTGAHGRQEGEAQLQTLKRVLESPEGPPDGLLTVPVTSTEAVTEVLRCFCEQGTQTVLIDNDAPVDRLCCIAPSDENTGRLAAELMCGLLGREGGTILLVGCNRYSPSHMANASGFADYVRTHRPDLGVIITGDEDGAPDAERYARLIADNAGIIAAYSVRARSTMPLCEAALRLEGARRLMLLGSDLFPESADMLRRGVLRGIIYKNPYEKGYRGLKVLSECLRSDAKPKADSLGVPISVILRSNLVFFEEFI
ncbi:MAG: LacI family DNA-binding transcriptional regulator [Clostridia bacterium]|nr:LacI family DNA-binding transcriptional regulator [Clostridia bacterium]